MPSEVRGTLIIKAKDEFSETVKKAGGAGKGLGDDLKKGLGGAVQEMTGLNLASLSLVGGITAVGAGIASSIKEAAAWGDAMGDLATKTGMSVKQASTLATVFNDVGLSTGTLEAAIKGATKNGFELNLTTLKKLGAEYRALEDPVARNKFAVQKFGRAGLELTEILSRTGEEIDALAVSAALSGKVIDEKAAAAAEKFNVKLKQTEDRITGLKIQIGNALIPVLTDSADSFSMLGTIWATVNVKGQQLYGIIDEQQAQLRLEAIVAGDTAAVFQEQMVPALEDVKRGTDDVYTATVMHSTALETHAGKLADDTTGYLNNSAAAWEAQGKTAALSAATGELTAALIFSTASKGMDEESAIKLGVAMGVLNKETADAVLELYAMKEAADTNHDGFISAAEAADGYSQSVMGLARELELIPNVDRYINIHYQSFGAEPGGESPVNYGTGDTGGTYGGMQAAGGDYMVTRPTWFLAGEAGPERATFTPQGKAGPGSDDTAMLLRALPALIARSVRDGLLQVAR